MAVDKSATKKGGTLTVLAPLVAVKNKKGDIVHLFAGDVVPEGTKQESIDHLLELGYLIESE